MRKNILEISGNALMYVFTFIQTKEIFEIISLVLSIIISAIILISNIIGWVKKATDDGKIDKEEIDDLVDILSETEKNKNDKESKL